MLSSIILFISLLGIWFFSGIGFKTKSDDKSENEIMAIRHKDFHTYGVQFHPESIMSEHGHQILKNFLEIK